MNRSITTVAVLASLFTLGAVAQTQPAAVAPVAVAGGNVTAPTWPEILGNLEKEGLHVTMVKDSTITVGRTVARPPLAIVRPGTDACVSTDNPTFVSLQQKAHDLVNQWNIKPAARNEKRSIVIVEVYTVFNSSCL